MIVVPLQNNDGHFFYYLSIEFIVLFIKCREDCVINTYKPFYLKRSWNQRVATR